MLNKIKEDFNMYKNFKYGFLINFFKILLNPGFLSIFIFRIADFLYTINSKVFYFPAKVIMLVPRILFSIEIEIGATINSGLKIVHGSGIVIGHKVVIGKNVVICQQVTLGGNNYKIRSFNDLIIEQPIIKDSVRLSPGAKVIGPIVIEKNSIIGVNAVVTKDVLEGEVIIGYNKRIEKGER